MKKITLFAAILSAMVTAQAQWRVWERLVPDPVQIATEPASARPAAVLDGLDSIQVRDIFVNGLIRHLAFEYDAYGHTTVTVDLSYDMSGNVTGGSKHTFSYNQAGKVDEQISYRYDNGWQPEVKYRFYYDFSDVLDSIYVFNYLNNTWEEAEHWYFSYDAAGRQVQQLIYILQTNVGWRPYKRITSTYAGDLLVERLDQRWDGANWNNYFKDTLQYNASNQLITEIHYQWMSGAWDPMERTDYTYHTSGRIASETRSSYDGTNWGYVSRILYTHDSQGVMTAMLFQDYDPTTTTWQNVLKFEFNHDYAVSRDQLLLPMEGALGMRENGLFDKKPLSARVLSGANLNYVANMNFYYSQHTVGTETTRAVPFRIYPNPADDVLFIEGTNARPVSATVFSITGNRTQARFGNGRVDLSELAPGLYILRITDRDGRQWSVKFLKL
ncbi:MAG: T9SS type A sorting domain-containing protein [Chlorobi bacterium]|nr:T9SS type A sorting domain-containing protein [Chlorobiota bacterium]